MRFGCWTLLEPFEYLHSSVQIPVLSYFLTLSTASSLKRGMKKVLRLDAQSNKLAIKENNGGKCMIVMPFLP